MYSRFLFFCNIEVRCEQKQVVSPILFNEAIIEKDMDDYYFFINHIQPDINESLTQLLITEVYGHTSINKNADIKSA
ncbi:hypothetical protein CWB75_19020, partial [Pseudoalteromonas sp. S1608]